MWVLIRFGFFLGDLLLLNLSLFLSYSFLQIEIWGAERTNSVYLFIFSNLTWLFLMVVANPYNVSRNWGIAKIIRSQLSFILIHLLVVASLIFLLRKSYLPEQIGLMYLLFVLSFFLWKLLVSYGSNFLSGWEGATKKYVIVGETNLAREVRRYFMVHTELGYRFCAYFQKEGEEYPVEKIKAFCATNNIAEVYCCLPEMSHTELRRMMDFGMNALIKVKLISDHRSFEQRTLALERYDQIPVFDISTIPLDNVWNLRIKRAFDIVFSVMATLLILSWLIPVLGIAIKLDSPGPVFFRQRRSGRDNKPFDCIKFRTMVVNQEADSKQATANDPRVTRLGAMLRKTSLDEFPQFLNVLQGDMSVVGPRPHPIKLNERFRPLINKYMIRHYVKPGVTGLAQVMGYRGETKLVRDMRNRITLDRFYIENWSFYFDIKIILMTIVSVVTVNDKAY